MLCNLVFRVLGTMPYAFESTVVSRETRQRKRHRSSIPHCPCCQAILTAQGRAFERLRWSALCQLASRQLEVDPSMSAPAKEPSKLARRVHSFVIRSCCCRANSCSQGCLDSRNLADSLHQGRSDPKVCSAEQLSRTYEAFGRWEDPRSWVERLD